ncbi:MAG: hypothetical protein AB7O52_17465 [Planctomycetota bacterium]
MFVTRLLLVATCVTLCGGCGSGQYLRARAHDLGDCFTARAALGVGLYAEAEVTTLVAPALGFADATLAPRYSWEWDPRRHEVFGGLRTAAFPTLLLAWPIYGHGETREGYGDTHPYWRGLIAPWALVGTHHIERRSTSLLGVHRLIPNPRLWDPEFDDEPRPTPRFSEHTWIAVSATPLLVRLDLGWNPLETFDWLVGIFGWDVLRDDSRASPGIESRASAAGETKSVSES